jgi:hypothetical protein
MPQKDRYVTRQTRQTVDFFSSHPALTYVKIRFLRSPYTPIELRYPCFAQAQGGRQWPSVTPVLLQRV